MRWIGFLILLYVATVFQTTIAPFIEIHGVRPDVLVIVAVYYGLMAQRYDALIAAWCVGMMVDLTSLGFHSYSNVGVCAIGYSIAIMMIVGLREYTFRDTPVAQVLYCFGAKVFISGFALLHMAVIVGDSVNIGSLSALALWEAGFTAVIAPYVCWILRRMHGGLGLSAKHRVTLG